MSGGLLSGVAFSDHVFGGATTTGGITWSTAAIKSASFAVAVGLIENAQEGDTAYAAIDSIELRVYYTYTPPAPTVTNNSASATFGVGGTVQMSASESPTTWSLTGSPPTGVSINSSGLVTWTGATPVGVHSIGVRATNAGGNGDGTLTLTITAAATSRRKPGTSFGMGIGL
ncbi:MAG: hypothetical protein SFV23_12720 [Planctomycetaceae bacterium]|nr:hypothetical protein [Planctomycetaceae bacterium]